MGFTPTYSRRCQGVVCLCSMKTLLRHTRTGLFFKGPDTWVTNPHTAYDFRFIDRAVQYVETWELKEVELAFAFEEPYTITTVAIHRTATRYAAA